MSATKDKPSLSQALKADISFYAFTALYGLGALGLALTADRLEKFKPFMYLQRWYQLPLVLFALICIWSGLRALRTPEPFDNLKQSLRSIFTPTRISAFLLFSLIPIFHGIFTSLKTLMTDFREFGWDEQLAELDYAIHGTDPWTLIPYDHEVVRIIQYVYILGWLSMLTLFSLYIIFAQNRALVVRYIWSFFFVWIILGNVTAYFFLSAGPVYYEHVTGSPRFEDQLILLDGTNLMPMSSVEMQNRLWWYYLFDIGALGSGISAFPSLHVAIATLWTLTAWYVSRLLSLVFAVLLITIQIGSVYLAWHYAVDGYFSFAATVLIWIVVDRVVSRKLSLNANAKI